MAKRPLKPCAHPGCPELTTGRYCAAHQKKAEEQKQADTRHYDQHQRDKEAKAFYNSPEWGATRKAVLIRDMGLCQECLHQGRVTHAETVHHKAELRENWDRRCDMTNLVSLCHSCHNRIHGKRGG